MLKLKANAGIPAVNFLMVAAAVLGASYLAVQSFDKDLTTNLGTMTSNHLTSLAAVDTANAPSEPGAGGGAGAGEASSAVTNLSGDSGFCRLSIVVPDGTGYESGEILLNEISECSRTLESGATFEFGNSPTNLCASKDNNYIEVDTSQVNKENITGAYLWTLLQPNNHMIYSYFFYDGFSYEEHSIEGSYVIGQNSRMITDDYACISWSWPS